MRQLNIRLADELFTQLQLAFKASKIKTMQDFCADILDWGTRPGSGPALATNPFDAPGHPAFMGPALHIKDPTRTATESEPPINLKHQDW